jgi:DNA polymerase-3 subunit gamma/tau
MSYLVMARKWRPRTFAEVVGQPVVVQTLQNAIRLQRVAQAYLFCGTRGVGKTTVARILAKALNCEKGPSPEPCGECRSCTEIAAGRALDIIEMDAASNRGIDDIRRLQEHILYKSFMRHKVVILDEAHMLTKEANNAFLKTLEEPPPHVVFVLATTEPHKLEETVVSRCQVFTFRRIDEEEIHRHLRKIAQAENIEVSDSTLDLLVRESEGSLRDAVVAFDQLVAFVGGRIGDAEAAQAMGSVERDSLHALMNAVVQCSASGLLAGIQNFSSAGIHLPRLAMEFLWYLRELLVLKSAEEPEKLLHLSGRDMETMKAMAAPLEEADLIRMLEIMSAAERELRWSRQPRYLLESAFLKMAYLRRLTPLEEALSRLQGGGVPSAPSTSSAASGGGSKPKASAAPPPAPERAPMRGQAPPSKGNGASGQSTAPGMAIFSIAEVVPEPQAPPATPKPAGEEMTQRLLEQLDKEQPLLAGYLEHASRWAWDGDSVRIYFASSREAARMDLEAKRAALTQAVEQAAGRSMEVLLLPLDPTDEDAAAIARKDDQVLLHEKLKLEATRDPLVQSIMNRFKAHVLEVEKIEKA